MHHKRKRPKSSRAGYLLCKPHKHQRCRKLPRGKRALTILGEPIKSLAGKSWPVHCFTIAISPNELLFGHQQAMVPDAETFRNLCPLHNLELFRQCEYVFSRDVLKDSDIVKTREAAAVCSSVVASNPNWKSVLLEWHPR